MSRMTEAEAQQALNETNEKIAAAFTEKGIHPIAAELLPVLHDEQGIWRSGAVEEQAKLVASALERLLAASNKDELCDAIVGLTHLSNEMYKNAASKDAAIALHVGCDRTIKTHALMEHLRSKAFDRTNAAVAAVKTAGGAPADLAARAPKLGEKPPEGSIKGGFIVPKRRI